MEFEDLGREQKARQIVGFSLALGTALVYLWLLCWPIDEAGCASNNIRACHKPSKQVHTQN